MITNVYVLNQKEDKENYWALCLLFADISSSLNMFINIGEKARLCYIISHGYCNISGLIPTFYMDVVMFQV